MVPGFGDKGFCKFLGYGGETGLIWDIQIG